MRVKTRKLRRPSSSCNQTLTAHKKSLTIMVFRDSLLEAYVDIETTGLSVHDGEITVIGLYLTNSYHGALVQLVGKDITKDNLFEALNGIQTIFTYNGSRFDLPFIHAMVGINLETMFDHHDLMHDCWKCNLRGGYQAVQQQLDISRYLRYVTGLDGVKLWRRYREQDDCEALTLLLGYNKEDIVNLKMLKERLPEMNLQAQ